MAGFFTRFEFRDRTEYRRRWRVFQRHDLGGLDVKPSKTLAKILDGSSNIHFKDMVDLIEAFGWNLTRINGSHLMAAITFSSIQQWTS